MNHKYAGIRGLAALISIASIFWCPITRARAEGVKETVQSWLKSQTTHDKETMEQLFRSVIYKKGRNPDTRVELPAVPRDEEDIILDLMEKNPTLTAHGFLLYGRWSLNFLKNTFAEGDERQAKWKSAMTRFLQAVYSDQPNEGLLRAHRSSYRKKLKTPKKKLLTPEYPFSKISFAIGSVADFAKIHGLGIPAEALEPLKKFPHPTGLNYAASEILVSQGDEAGISEYARYADMMGERQDYRDNLARFPSSQDARNALMQIVEGKFHVTHFVETGGGPGSAWLKINEENRRFAIENARQLLNGIDSVSEPIQN